LLNIHGLTILIKSKVDCRWLNGHNIQLQNLWRHLQ